MRRAVRWYRNTVFEGGIYYGTIQRHRHELCSLQRPCGKAVNKVPGVTSCSVSLLTNSMGVEGTASASAIVSAVEEAGYGCSLKGASGQKEPVSDAEKALEDHETPLLRKRLIASVGFLLVLMYFSMGHMMWGWPLPAWFDGNISPWDLYSCFLQESSWSSIRNFSSVASGVCGTALRTWIPW